MLRHLYIVAKDKYDLAKFNLTNVIGSTDLITLIDNSSWNKSMAQIGNYIIETNKDRAVVGMVHADVDFAPGDLNKCFEKAWAQYRLVGIVGRVKEKNHWGHEGEMYVSTLDCCSAFWDTTTPVKFDEEVFDGFHLYLEDACLTLYEKHNMPSFTPHLKPETTHKGSGDTNYGWYEDYLKYKVKLIEKHPGYMTTWWTTGEN
jgi:hypothetical protein